MSKNVAVFVDVANIFYAAKAAGVDIDYVTLLKSATAGRDFVRAYAYTGLDPENENQRQFHAFLARSGYKVISKDIRKYGDGRIKANLDIELVVDMMRMAQHIDIAVVVSGDGDFAPAIRAVQQLGVRCEVISFRGNTSSDLIDVADVFTDITQIARVEKGERSGRRVAAEGDLSMTAVPEKETEGLARRRRSRRDEPEQRVDRNERVDRVERVERPERPAAEALPGNLIVLPGERLSRAGGPEDGEFDGDIDEGAPRAAEATSLDAADEGQLDGTEADRQRRRRRRGGRGRGRGRQQFDTPQQYDTPRPAEGGVDIVTEDEEFLEDEIAPLPQHSTFGSVWDNQLGVTPPPITAATGEPGIDEEYEDEPEIPEYLLAERRQRGRGGRPAGMRQAGRQQPRRLPERGRPRALRAQRHVELRWRQWQPDRPPTPAGRRQPWPAPAAASSAAADVPGAHARAGAPGDRFGRAVERGAAGGPGDAPSGARATPVADTRPQQRGLPPAGIVRGRDRAVRAVRGACRRGRGGSTRSRATNPLDGTRRRPARRSRPRNR